MHSGTTTALGGRILQRIAENPAASISFADFMGAALYDPEFGYYSDPARQVGRARGDFYTSVSVGDTFGRLLADAAAERWRELGEPAEFILVEQGAHDGQLAIDLLAGLAECAPEMAECARYVVIEPLAARRELIAGRLAEAGHQADVVADSAGRKPVPAGIFLCNELVDALPVHRVRWDGERWRELRVAANMGDDGGSFRWLEADIEPGSALGEETARIDTGDFSAGYTTEVNLAMRDWIASVAGLFEPGGGRWWLIDYGHAEADFFSPERREGTLRCYREHRAGDDPFTEIGRTDITAHVNFTRLADWARECGLRPANPAGGAVDQHDFLTRIAVDWLRSLEKGTSQGSPLSAKNQARVRQFQTLTHPGMMGRVFKVLELVN